MFISTVVLTKFGEQQSMTPSKRSMPRQTESPSLKKRKQLTMDDYLSSVYILLITSLSWFRRSHIAIFLKLTLWYCDRGRRKNKWTYALYFSLGKWGWMVWRFWYGLADISSDGLVWLPKSVIFCGPEYNVWILKFCKFTNKPID